jgi:hypothetical protein
MTEIGVMNVMHDFLDAFAEGDFIRARSYLANQHFRYVSTLSTFNDADAFITDISRVGAIMKKIECRRTFVDGTEICVITNIKTSMSGLRSTPVVFWATIVSECIVTMETFFDAREYAAMFKTE